MANTRKWYEINARAPEAHVYILDEIGAFGVTAKSFIADLRALGGKPFTLHVNSPGGDLFEALPIYNALDTHPGHVTGLVEGVAASAASFLLMAADTVVMPANSMMMIHNSAVAAAGGVETMNEGARLLSNLDTSMANAYAAKSGLPVERVRAMMAATTWMTAEEALALGFADEVRAAVKVAASFDLSKYPNAPRAHRSWDELATIYWAAKGKGKATAQVSTNPDGISDLIPAPITTDRAFNNFAGRFAGRK